MDLLALNEETIERCKRAVRTQKFPMVDVEILS